VRPDGVAGLRAHRSHTVVDIGECPIAHPAITDLGILARRWPGTASVEAVAATGSGERAVIITPGGAGPGGRPPGTPRAWGGSTPPRPPWRPPGPAWGGFCTTPGRAPPNPRARSALPQPSGRGTGLAGQRGRVLAGASQCRRRADAGRNDRARATAR
jgi:hypothetical protein